MQKADYRIIGLSGTNGSGKDTVGIILAERYGFLFISVTELLRDEAKRRGLAVERENLRKISAEWRRQSGLGVLIDKAVAQYEQVRGDYKGLAIASLRNPGEADRTHEFGGTVVWVDADPKLRYERIQANKSHRGRLEEDNKTYAQFMAEEQQEMRQTGDEATLNMRGVKDKVDLTLTNEFQTQDDLAKYLANKLDL